MKPLTFEQIIVICSFILCIINILNGSKAYKRANQEDAMRLVRIEEGIKQLRGDAEDGQKAFTAYMARTDEVISTLKENIAHHDTRLAVVEDVTRTQAGRLERLEKAHTH